MTPATLPDEASPLLDDLDGPLIHEERLPPVRTRPRAEDIVFAISREFGLPLRECKMLLCAMNFEQVNL